jgi:hypothetical protein
MIFVFGSNLAGRHGKGAALTAKIDFGAEYGVGIGRTGDAYAIPTKSSTLETLTLDIIEYHVDRFIEYALSNKDLEFFVTRVGCGLAGYKDCDIGPMFKAAPNNCKLPLEWEKFR